MAVAVAVGMAASGAVAAVVVAATAVAGRPALGCGALCPHAGDGWGAEADAIDPPLPLTPRRPWTALHQPVRGGTG